MAQLVGKRAHVVVLAVVVQQHVRMHVVASAVAIGPAPFFGRRIDVGPTLAVRSLDQFDVIGSQRLHGPGDQLDGFLVGVLHLDVLDDRCVDVGVFQLVDAEHAFLQPQIAMERIEVPMDVLDQRVVDLDRDVVLVQRTVQRRIVTPHSGVEHVLIDLRGHLGAERLLELFEGSEEGRKDGFAIGPIVGRSISGKGRLIERDLRAVGEFDFRERQLGVAEDRVDRTGRRRQQARLGQDLLFLDRKPMGLGALNVVEVHPVDLQAGFLLNEGIDRCLIHGSDLGHDERGVRTIVGNEQPQRLLHALVLRDARVFVRLHRRIAEDPREFLIDGGAQC